MSHFIPPAKLGLLKVSKQYHQLGTKGTCGGHFSAQEVTARIWTLGERHCSSQTQVWERWQLGIYRRSEAEAASPLGFKKKMHYSYDSKVQVHGQPPGVLVWLTLTLPGSWMGNTKIPIWSSTSSLKYGSGWTWVHSLQGRCGAFPNGPHSFSLCNDCTTKH